MKKIFLLFGLLLILIAASACRKSIAADTETPPTTPPLSAAFTAPKEDDVLVITAVGDIMMHDTLINAAYRRIDNTYDFSPFFKYIKPPLLASDLTIGNLETTFAGSKAGYSGYPRFNSPENLALDLKDAGFDILLTANNHCLDKGQSGLERTLDTLDAAGILHTGTFRSLDERNTTLILEKKGVRIAVLAYTYGTNGFKPAKEKPFSVNYLSVETICADIKKARSKDAAQLIIVGLHFGIEYQKLPSAEQKQIARLLLEEGADAVLGYHPHVLQPAYIFTPADEGSDKKFAIYSLGNFISDQKGLERVSSIMLNLYYEIDSASGKPHFKKASYIPIRTRLFRQDGRMSFEVLPLEAALASSNREQSLFTRREQQDLESSLSYIRNHLRNEDPAFDIQPLAIPLEALDLLKKWQ